MFDRAGSFVIQFVDCADQPGHVGVWWGGGAARSSAVPVRVALGPDVVGLTPGVDYRCEVAASVGGLTVATSGAMSVVTPSSSPPPPQADEESVPTAHADDDTGAQAPSRLAFTGSALLPLLTLSLALIAGGLAATGHARSRVRRRRMP